ncbi:tail fiber assembly protein (plasmid) [Morganella morganii]|uniref:Tail fiber assembly protein n=1 Tax=Morganella morganii TaxID=582 RepID=A0A433ZRY2_MORMO|nr:tail fiber assembly protein [Morganella morganii]RUT64885.1 tail fiber assembly protein [Morganella morganii]
MKYIFDKKTNAFYPVAMKQEYENAGMWPESGVEITEEVFASFRNPPEGKMMGSDKKGNPVWVDVPPLTHEQCVAIAESQKQALIAEVHTETEMLRTKLALGRIKDDEKARLIAWLDYLDELEAVDVSTAPDIIWPVKPVV